MGYELEPIRAGERGTERWEAPSASRIRQYSLQTLLSIVTLICVVSAGRVSLHKTYVQSNMRCKQYAKNGSEEADSIPGVTVTTLAGAKTAPLYYTVTIGEDISPDALREALSNKFISICANSINFEDGSVLESNNVEQLAKLQYVQHIHIKDTSGAIREEDLALLRKLPSLASLVIAGERQNDEILSEDARGMQP